MRLLTKPESLRAFLRFERSELKPRRLQAVVCALAACVSATVPLFVRADTPPASPTTPNSESGLQSSTPNAVSASTDNNTQHTATPQNRDAAKKAAPASRGFDRNAVLSRTLTRGQYLVRTALNYRGLPYRWGGTSPRSGFDCSGLVQTVYAKWGIYLPRCAHEQVAKGIPIPKDKLQAGDLVFFKNTYKRGLSHVGIYVGEGWFIHAASRRTGVIISRLDAPYHLHHWYGARRLDLSKLPPVPGEEQAGQQRVILDENGTAETEPQPQGEDQSPPDPGR
jgi:cell wall-associated NlpC family hydrolase